MNREPALPASLEQVLGRLLHVGTYVASAVIAIGLVLGMRIATVGIVLFILLPVIRLAAMLVFFSRARDFRFAAIAALVLLIIALSFLAGTR
jgi:uncharacterized membrane protein